MGLFSNGICPICNKQTNMTNKSSIKHSNDYICSECIKKIGNQGIIVFNLKKYSLNELKQIVHNNDVKTGKILECPNCRSHNLELLSNDNNYKIKQKTTINMNPLKVFTIANTKTVKKEIAKEHNEYFCKDCGNRWIGI